ncbi:hypothetical protein PV325_009615, partial [Microctonus aethiopoides]
GINDSGRADSTVSLPDISRVCIKSSDRMHGAIKHRHDTDGIITRQEKLTSDHMDMFQEICEDFTNGFYKQQSCLLIQMPQTIKPACPFKKHIQILNKVLNEDCRKYLSKLFPLYELNNNTVIFPTVQQQPNGYDCGVFSIAFAVTLLYGLAPELIQYEHGKMRDHFLRMLNTNVIDHFPIDYRQTARISIPTLIEVIERDKQEYLRRIADIDHDATCICCT